MIEVNTSITFFIIKDKQMKTTMNRREKIIQLLTELSASNLLNDKILDVINKVYKVDSAKLCKDNNIRFYVENIKNKRNE